MKTARRYLRPIAVIASTALFVCLLRRTGPAAILQNIRVLGWGIVALIVLSGIRQVLRALAWSYCMPTDGQRPSALQLMGARLVGEALNDLTPAGPLLGEPAKAVAASRLVPAQMAASSVVLENLIYALSAILSVLTGVALALVAVAALRGFWWIGGGLMIGSVACLSIVCWAVSRRVLVLGRMLDSLKRCGWRWTFLERHELAVRAVEQTVYDFFLKSRPTFLAVLAIEIATNFTGVAEACLILRAGTAHSSLFAAYLVESASRAVQIAFSFVPLGLGVQEGAAAATLQAVGYAASVGVSLAVIRKIRSLFWATVGLVFFAKYSILLPAAEKEHHLV